MTFKITTDDMLLAMKFYMLQFFDKVNGCVNVAEFFPQFGEFEGNDVIHSFSFFTSDDDLIFVSSICFVSEYSFYVIFDICEQLRVISNKYISLDNYGNIRFDKQRFIDERAGKYIRVDLEMCNVDFIKTTDDYIRFERIGLITI